MGLTYFTKVKYIIGRPRPNSKGRRAIGRRRKYIMPLKSHKM